MLEKPKSLRGHLARRWFVGVGIILAVGACCKRDGMWTTWCPDTGGGGGSSGSNPCWVYQERKNLDSSCGCASAEGVYLKNSSSKSRTVNITRTTIKSGSSASNTYTDTMPGNWTSFLGCSVVSSPGNEYACDIRQSWSHACSGSSLLAVATSAELGSGGPDGMRSPTARGKVSASVPSVDCPSLCSSFDPLCYSLRASSSKSVEQIPALVNFLSPLLRDSATTQIPMADLIAAIGVSVDPCSRHDTVVAGAQVENAGPECGMVYDDQVFLFVPGKLLGTRSNVTADRVRVEFDPLASPEIDSRAPALAAWTGQVSEVVISSTEKAAWAQVGSSCLEVTW